MPGLAWQGLGYALGVLTAFDADSNRVLVVGPVSLNDNGDFVAGGFAVDIRAKTLTKLTQLPGSMNQELTTCTCTPSLEQTSLVLC
jgi:hypothetical protein